MVNLITPVRRVAKAPRPEPIPYTGKKANASLTTNGFGGESVADGTSFDAFTVHRTLGTDLFVLITMQLVSFTANVGASNLPVALTVSLSRGGSGLSSLGFDLPIVGITNASPQVIRYGGHVGPFMYTDTDDASGDQTYQIGYSLTPDNGAAILFYWQEMRRY